MFGWLSISEILQNKKYNLNPKRVQNSLCTIGKQVKAEYENLTGETVKETPKHLGSGHRCEKIKVYPPNWFNDIERIAINYFG